MRETSDAMVIPFPVLPRPIPRETNGIEIVALRLTNGGRELLDGLTATLAPGGITAIIGPNGAGKSLLLRSIAGLIVPDHGHIRLPARMRGRIAHVAQRPVLLRRSVRGNLAHALRLAGRPRRDRRARLAELLTLGRLVDLAHVPARRLSGGERQRLAIVRALARDPALLLLDEPGTGLDPHAMQALESLLNRIAARGTKIVLVTHDLGQLARIAGEIAFLHAGQCHEVAPATAFLDRPQSVTARAYLDGDLLL